MKLTVSNHAQKRFRERFNLENEKLTAALMQNLQTCKVYKQNNSQRLVECDDFVLGIALIENGNWEIQTVMDTTPYYATRDNLKARETSIKPKIEFKKKE